MYMCININIYIYKYRDIDDMTHDYEICIYHARWDETCSLQTLRLTAPGTARLRRI